MSPTGEKMRRLIENLSKSADAFYGALMYNKSMTDNGAAQPHETEGFSAMNKITAALVGGLFDEGGVSAYARPVLFGTAGDAVRQALPDIEYDELSGILVLQRKKPEPIGCVAVCTGGTSDIPVAEEAARTAEYFGSRVERIYDVGVAGIHRLLANTEHLRAANCIIAVAGMEGALPGVVAGLVDKPVLAVPTSVGYGAHFHGLSPLLTMLNSCAEGIAVVNIDNGFGAGYMATQINRLAVKGRTSEGE